MISQEFPPETGWGGIGTYTHNLAHGLAELGHRVHVIARTWGAKSVTGADGVVVHRIPVPAPSWKPGTWFVNIRFPQVREMFFWNLEVQRCVREIAWVKAPDVVECPEFGAQGLMAAVQGIAPMVIKLHTPTFLCRQVNGVSFGGSRWDDVLSERAEHWLARRAGLLTSPSRALANDVSRQWKMDSNAVRVIPNPIDEDLFRPPVEAARDANVLFVGRLERRKGVQTLIDAWAAVASAFGDAQLQLVGKDHESAPDGGSMKRHLKRCLTAAGGRGESVEFCGAVHRAALPQVYGAAQVCVVPSLYENFPYTCLEAMACGRAVIGSNVGGIPEIITDEVDGLLVPPGDCEALSRAILRLLQDAELRQRLGATARRTICQRFARRAVCQQTAAAYRELVS
jgi:glycogen synthase